MAQCSDSIYRDLDLHIPLCSICCASRINSKGLLWCNIQSRHKAASDCCTFFTALPSHRHVGQPDGSRHTYDFGTVGHFDPRFGLQCRPVDNFTPEKSGSYVITRTNCHGWQSKGKNL